MTAKLHPDVAKLAKAVGAGARLDVILRVEGDPASVARALPKGVRVRRTFTLAPGLAVSVRADAIAALAAVPGVASIEPDRDVHSQQGG